MPRDSRWGLAGSHHANPQQPIHIVPGSNRRTRGLRSLPSMGLPRFSVFAKTWTWFGCSPSFCLRKFRPVRAHPSPSLAPISRGGCRTCCQASPRSPLLFLHDNLFCHPYLRPLSGVPESGRAEAGEFRWTPMVETSGRKNKFELKE